MLESDEFEPSVIELKPCQVLSEPTEELITRIVNDLRNYKIVLVPLTLEGDLQETVEYAANQGIESEDVPGIVSDFLANLTKNVVDRTNLILMLIGGETSYKCCNAIESKHLQLIDEVEHAIPLCLDHKAQWIITKSGNLGGTNTILNMLRYFEKHQDFHSK
ncbi:MAG: hypothetical protein MZV64_64745 [Ignavibacteriales bacterium]|nr:hypothetical protein [Ignavibacteriales bacterium]